MGFGQTGVADDQGENIERAKGCESCWARDYFGECVHHLYLVKPPVAVRSSGMCGGEREALNNAGKRALVFLFGVGESGCKFGLNGGHMQ